MPENPKRADAAVLPVRLPRATKRLLDRAAHRRHKTVSGFIRDAAVAEANRVLGIETAPAGATQVAEAESAAA